MKGKNRFTSAEIEALHELIKRRQNASQEERKKIRAKMRKIGFFGRDDWGIVDCRLADLDNLIKCGGIIVVGQSAIRPKMASVSKPISQAPMPTVLAEMQFDRLENLQTAGFSGFISIANLWKDSSGIPKTKGVYMVVRTTSAMPKFLTKGTGAYYKNQDPNVSIDTLKANWIDHTCVLYIGQTGGGSSAGILRKRLQVYLKFGQGKKSAGHRGGCFIWQIDGVANLLFCWKPLPADDPKIIESSLIALFKEQHDGRRPFANRQD